MAGINFTLAQSRLQTLDENDNVINNYVGAAIVNAKNVIGEKKRITLVYNATDDYAAPFSMANVKVFVNFALFVEAGFINLIQDEGQNYFSFHITDPITPNTTYDMDFTCAGAIYPEPGRNFSCKIKTVTTTQFQIILTYYQTYDGLGFINPLNDINISRFKKDRVNNPLDFEVSGNSIYNDTSREFRAYLFARADANPTLTGFVNTSIAGYAAKFFDASPFITNVNWEFVHNGSVVTKLYKSSGGTDVNFKFKCTTPVNKVIVSICRDDQSDPTKNFIDNYELEQKTIAPASSNGNLIIGPYSSSQLGADFTYSFKIDPANLVDGRTYRFFAVIYSGADVIGSISMRMVNGVPISYDNPYRGGAMDFTGRLCDVQTEFSGNNLQCVIEERMRSKVRINYGSGKFAADILARLGLTVINDIRKYLTKVDFSIYQEYNDPLLGGIVRNYFDQRVGVRVNPTTYSAGNMTLTFGTDWAEFQADWRNRYEAGTNIPQTTLNNVNFLPVQDVQYWGGKTMIVEWRLTFYYDDYISPFTDYITFRQMIRVKDYEPTKLSLVSQVPEDETKEFWCNDDFMCLQSVLDPSIRYNGGNPAAGNVPYALINNIEQAPGSILTIEEAEAWVPEELIQLTTPKIYNQEVMFSDTVPFTGKWCIDTSKLLLNSQYKISVIAKKYKERCRRVIETLDPRVTELQEQRVPENCINN